MAYATAKVYIQQAERAIRVELFFPTDLPEVGDNVRGVITLLHGLSNSSLEWPHLTAAYRYASDKGYILVIPEAQNSFYNDMYYGAPFFSILTKYLPEQLNRIFRIPSDAAINHIAGNSMGGYGALRIGLANPDRYRCIGSFSGVVDIAALAEAAAAVNQPNDFLVPVLGPKREVLPQADTFWLLEQAAALPTAKQPRVLATCGLQDIEPYDILAQNRRLAAHAKGLPIDYRYLEWEGAHEWYFWDRSLVEFIAFIENDDYATQKKAQWTAPCD